MTATSQPQRRPLQPRRQPQRRLSLPMTLMTLMTATSQPQRRPLQPRRQTLPMTLMIPMTATSQHQRRLHQQGRHPRPSPQTPTILTIAINQLQRKLKQRRLILHLIAMLKTKSQPRLTKVRLKPKLLLTQKTRTRLSFSLSLSPSTLTNTFFANTLNNMVSSQNASLSCPMDNQRVLAS